MDADPYKRSLSSLVKAEPGEVLVEWVEAVTNFHRYYNKLTSCLDAASANVNQRRKAPSHISQCPVEQIDTLLNAMHCELERLLRDLDQIDVHPESNQLYFQKLVDHTIFLNHLNQQAQTRLLLAARPTS